MLHQNQCHEKRWQLRSELFHKLSMPICAFGSYRPLIISLMFTPSFCSDILALCTTARPPNPSAVGPLPTFRGGGLQPPPAPLSTPLLYFTASKSNAIILSFVCCNPWQGKQLTSTVLLLLYESYGMQISDADGSHFCVWRHRSSLTNRKFVQNLGFTSPDRKTSIWWVRMLRRFAIKLTKA